MPGPALAAGGSLVGAGISALNQRAAERKRNRILRQGHRQQNRAGMESASVVGDFVSELRNSAPDPAAERGMFSAALGNERVSGPPTASRAFRTGAAEATAGAQGYGRDMADQFARIRAPSQQRQREGQLLMAMGNQLRPIQMRAQDDEFLTQLRASNVKTNPWLDLLGQGLSSAGNYAVANG